MLVCLVPFVVVNTALLTILAMTSFPLFLWGMLLFHVAACGGAAAIVNDFWEHRGRGLLCYDDAAAGKTYSYVAASAVGQHTPPRTTAKA